MNLRVRHLSVACLTAALAVFTVFYAPAGAAEQDVTLDFGALRQEAPDAVGWIQIEGTYLNYPVVRGEDNDYYLTRLPNGKPGDSGSIFMDCRNAQDFTDKNTLIHGHRMKSGAMFGVLKSYVLQGYYDSHPVVTLFTPQGRYDVELFACYTFEQTDETLPLEFEDDQDFMSYVQGAKNRSTFQSGVEVGPGDSLVTLVTCDTDYDDGRLALVGKLIR